MSASIARWRARSCSSGPGATAVRSACSSTWSTGSGSSGASAEGAWCSGSSGDEQRAAVGRHPAESGDADHRGLLDRPGDRLVARGRAAGPQPGHPLDERRDTGARREHLARLEPVELAERGAPGLGQPRPLQVGGERVDRLAGLPSADQPGQPGRLEPGQRQPGPPVRDRRRAPDVERVGGQPRGVAVGGGAGGEQVRGERRSRRAGRRCAPRLCSSSAAALSSRTPRPPVRSAEGGVVPQCSSSSSTCRTSSKAAPAAARSTRAASRDEVASAGTRSARSTRRVPAAQADRHLPRHRHVRAVPGDQQPPGQQLVDGAAAPAAGRRWTRRCRPCPPRRGARGSPAPGRPPRPAARSRGRGRPARAATASTSSCRLPDGVRPTSRASSATRVGP